MDVKAILEKSILYLISNQLESGEISPGINGPYKDKETPIRNTAHFVFLTSRYLQKYSNNEFHISFKKASQYLLKNEFNPYGFTYLCRQTSNKDTTNGIIGQAWVIEALMSAYKYTNDNRFLEKAKKLYFTHNYCEEFKFWEIRGIDGRKYSADKTFNHQLWFAACASSIEDNNIENDIFDFFDKVASDVQIYNNGVIFHLSKFYFSNYKLKNIKFLFRNALIRLINKKSLYKKSVGYHYFNLYAFKILKNKYPNHNFWVSKKWNMMMNICFNNKFNEILDESIYSYQYNSPAFLAPFIFDNFPVDISSPRYKNFFLNYPSNLQTCDINTLISRSYELSRYEDW